MARCKWLISMRLKSPYDSNTLLSLLSGIGYGELSSTKLSHSTVIMFRCPPHSKADTYLNRTALGSQTLYKEHKTNKKRNQDLTPKKQRPCRSSFLAVPKIQNVEHYESSEFSMLCIISSDSLGWPVLVHKFASSWLFSETQLPPCLGELICTDPFSSGSPSPGLGSIPGDRIRDMRTHKPASFQHVPF